MFTAALETAYGEKMDQPVFTTNSALPATELIVMTFARDFWDALRSRGRKMLIVLMTPRVLTLNCGYRSQYSEGVKNYGSYEIVEVFV